MSGNTSATPPENFASSARRSLIWGGGFLIIRDVLQFASMLILIRLLSPADYGTAALAQAVNGFASAFAFASFSGHALQARDPTTVDWQAHFTAGVAINFAVCVSILGVAISLGYTETYAAVALPLAFLAVSTLVEVPVLMRHRMLEATHDWIRLRALMLVGVVLGLATGIIVAMLGGGVWAIIVQSLISGLPMAIDLFVTQKFRPTWSCSWARYREPVHFGLRSAFAGVFARGRPLAEGFLLARQYDLAMVGHFTRAFGLCTLFAGRFGELVISCLYPIITRSEPGSLEFKRNAGLIIRCLSWVVVPAAAMLILTAKDAVHLVYGADWGAIVPMMPLAVVIVAIGNISAVLISLMLATGRPGTCLAIAVITHSSGVGLTLILLPMGLMTFLISLCAHSVVCLLLTSVTLRQIGGIEYRDLLGSFAPPIVAASVSMIVVFVARDELPQADIGFFRIVSDSIIFGMSYLAVLRVVFPGLLADLCLLMPGGRSLARTLAINLQAREA